MAVAGLTDSRMVSDAIRPSSKPFVSSRGVFLNMFSRQRCSSYVSHTLWVGL